MQVLSKKLLFFKYFKEKKKRKEKSPHTQSNLKSQIVKNR